jgi:hypothetical protein
MKVPDVYSPKAASNQKTIEMPAKDHANKTNPTQRIRSEETRKEVINDRNKRLQTAALTTPNTTKLDNNRTSFETIERCLRPTLVYLGASWP